MNRKDKAPLETPYRLLSALRYFMGAALPFIFFCVAVEKGFEGRSFRALACLGAAVLTLVVAVYWDRFIPARFRDKAKELEYLRTEQSFIWVALPFTFSFIAVARFFDGGRSGRYEALGFLAMAVLTFVVGVCWDRITLAFFRKSVDGTMYRMTARAACVMGNPRRRLRGLKPPSTRVAFWVGRSGHP